MLSLDYFGLTDAGKVRQNNEDALLFDGERYPALFAVADGVGGFEAGEVASSMTIEAIKELGPGDSLASAIQEANHRVYSAARDDEKLSGMGTTVVAVRLVESGESIEAEVSHVGDSRVYLLREGELEPLTEDHSLVAELVRSGSLTRTQASEHPQKNLITRALGAEGEVEVDSDRHRLRRGDRLVLCSDGLPDMVPESRISELVSGDEAGNAEESARGLISAALSAGGTDNVTVVVVDVDRAAQSPEPDSTQTLAAHAGETAHRVRERTEREDHKNRGAPDTEPAPETGPPEDENGSSGDQTVRRRSRGREQGSSRGMGSRQRSWKRDNNYTRLRKGESLIPGVWDGALVEETEEPEEPREPTPEEVVEQFRVRPATDVRETSDDPRRRRRKKRFAKGQKAVSALIRSLAAVAVLGILLLPPYLWWSTRYFMAYDGGEVVIYQGVPYDFLGNELNRLDHRPGVDRSDIAEPYREQIQDNRLYTEDRLQTVLKDLQKN